MGNALEDAAVVEARAGRREAARDAITEAMAAYSTLGAVWDARRAKSRLRAEGLQIGARGPRKRPSTGLAALTPTEHRIAQLVAAGGSNTEIAERLVLSRRTVEVHVSHILAKLQIRSRRDVARAITS
jgi:DNA-binding NarL/FixJ family response regulator